MVIKHSPRMFNQPDNKFTYYQLLFKTHFVCVKMSDFTIAEVLSPLCTLYLALFIRKDYLGLYG